MTSQHKPIDIIAAVLDGFVDAPADMAEEIIAGLEGDGWFFVWAPDTEAAARMVS